MSTRLGPRVAGEGPLDRLASERTDQRVFTAVAVDNAARSWAASTWRAARGASLGPLDGVPVAVKDNIDVAGLPTTNGSVVSASGGPVPDDARIVRMLRRAGAVVLAKTNQSELAFSGLGLNPHFGSPPNPVVVGGVVPGGSSSGSAVAVAQGRVPVALGTDTSGSVRVPAAFCGIVGFAPSQDLLPRHGVRPLSTTLDSVGLLARDVATMEDVVLALGVLNPVLARRRHPHPRFVVPDGELVDCAEPVRGSFRSAVDRLLAAGHRVVGRRLPVLEEAQELMDRFGTVVAADAFLRHGHLLSSPRRELVDPAVLDRLEVAAAVVDTVAPVRRAMAELRRRVREELGPALLLCPTVRHSPPRVAAVLRSTEEQARINAVTLRTTMLLSYLGMPGVSVPPPEASASSCPLPAGATPRRSPGHGSWSPPWPGGPDDPHGGVRGAPTSPLLHLLPTARQRR